MKKIIIVLLFAQVCSGQVYVRPLSLSTDTTKPIISDMYLNGKQPGTPDLKLKFLPGIHMGQTAIGLSLMFLSGVASGYNEVILHHYPQFKRVHPEANDSYFNPDESWLRKYKNHDPSQGPAFWQSTGSLAAFTDFYHLTGVMDHGALLCGSVVLVIGEKRKWYEYAIQIVGGIAVRSAGFSLIYDVIYK